MPLFDTMTNFLKGPVGNNLDNDPEDIRNTKASLNELGYFDEEIENDFITRTLDTNIKSFQKDNDLKVDGKLYPNGETENSIIQNLASSQLLPVAASTYSSQAETRSPAIASFGQVAENVDATGRMTQDQTASTQSPIQAEEPQQSEMPEEQNEPQSDTRNECASLSIELQNARLQLEDFTDRHKRLGEQHNSVLHEYTREFNKLEALKAKAGLDIGLAFATKGRSLAGSIGKIKTTAKGSNQISKIQEQSEKVKELKEKFENIKENMAYLDTWIEKTHTNIDEIERKMQEKGCRTS